MRDRIELNTTSDVVKFVKIVSKLPDRDRCIWYPWTYEGAPKNEDLFQLKTRWEFYKEHPSGYEGHRCPSCLKPAIYIMVEEECFDEGFDGELFSLGMMEVGIKEYLTDYCPHCGEKMKLEDT